MKKILCCLLLLLVLSSCDGLIRKITPRAEGEVRVGDIIMVDGEMGVVFAVTSDGQHGKVMSVAESQDDWYGARDWASQLGCGWRLPTVDELLTIYRNKRALNSVLDDGGYTEFGDSSWVDYWSCESADDNRYAYTVDIDDSAKSYGNSNKSNDNYVRAVSVF